MTEYNYMKTHLSLHLWKALIICKGNSIVFLFFFKYRDKEARDLWSELQLKLPTFFNMLDDIQPALMHGDLWGGNAGENQNGPGRGQELYILNKKRNAYFLLVKEILKKYMK
jgi:hypothetical protein